jgi:two-component system, NarL family, sensor kinase
MKPSSKTIIFFVSLAIYGILSINCYPQPPNILDSLQNIMKYQAEDTNKVRTILLISREYEKKDPGEAMHYINNSLKLATQLNYATGIIDATVRKSYIYTLTGQLDSAKIFSQKAISLSYTLKDKKRIADSYAQHAINLLRIEGPSDSTQKYYLRSHQIYKEIGDSTGYMNSLNGMGIIYYRQAEYDSAIYYYIEYLKLCEKFKNEEGLGKGYVNLGTTYYELKDFINAEHYLKESIKVNEKYNNLRFLSIAYNNLGSIAFNENNLDEAMYYYSLSQELNSKINNAFGLAQTKSNIGNIYERRKEYSVAMDYYNKAKDLFESIQNIDGFIAAYKNIALIHERRKNYDEALTIYDSCLNLAKTSNLFKREEEILFNIHRTYELTGDFKKAYQIQTEWVALKDSIFNLDKDKQIKNLQVKYDKEKDQARILTLENENLAKNLDLRKRTNQRNGYMYSVLGLVLIISFVFIFYRHKAIKDKIISDQKIKELEEEKKLLAARSIVNGQEEERKRIAEELHDGLGVLLSTAKMQFSSIKDKSPENRPLIEKASKLLEQATGDVRRISHNMMPGLLTKFGFFEAVEDLFEQINDMDDINAKMLIEGETSRLPGNMEIMLYRVVQELTNNTLKHAEAQNVSLIIKILKDQLFIQFSDDGKGFVVEEKVGSKSIGLDSIFSRVKFLNGSVNLESKPGKGCTYFIRIPLLTSN